MDPMRWSQIETLFTRAIGLAPDVRAQFLDQATADESIKNEVRLMLRHDDEQQSASAQVSDLVHDAGQLWAQGRAGGYSAIGRRVGVYKITGIAGE
ncbi:MAG TPA: hypothetical protein VFA59_17655, partial [Vicinamibacterales bacterium]|nr:hypothetical protein [Vicinamibacterales bacterium]